MWIAVLWVAVLMLIVAFAFVFEGGVTVAREKSERHGASDISLPPPRAARPTGELAQVLAMPALRNGALECFAGWGRTSQHLPSQSSTVTG
jgi:hypothetical protein